MGNKNVSKITFGQYQSYIFRTKFEIQQFVPQNEKVQRQLELQMEAERRRRQQELDTMSALNIAEGNRKTTVLESEGKFHCNIKNYNYV